MIICLHGLFHVLLWTRRVINLWLTKIIQCQSFGIKIRLVIFFQFVVFDYSFIYILFGVCLLNSVSLAPYEGNFRNIKADTSNSMLLYRSGANDMSPPIWAKTITNNIVIRKQLSIDSNLYRVAELTICTYLCRL